MDIRPVATPTPTGPGSAERQASAPTSTAPFRPVSAPVVENTTVQQPSAVPDTGALAEALKNVNKMLREANPPQNLEFSIDSESDQVIVKVVDQHTKEVLRQIPSEEALEIARALDLSKGLILRQKA